MLLFLLESAARSLALGIVVWLALRLLRVRTPQTRSLAWTAVLVSSAAMPFLIKAMASVPPTRSGWIPVMQMSPPLSVVSLPRVPMAAATSLDWNTIAWIVYFTIGGVLLTRLIAGLLRGQRLVRHSVTLKESWNSGSDLRVSEHLTIPATYGSTILFPADWQDWSDFKRDAVIVHERTHVRRRDFYVHVLADLFRCAFWFNPMAWWLRSELLELAEAACDDEAIRKLADRVSYAEVLIEFASKGSIAGFAGVPMASGRTVTGRVERMLRGDSIGRPPSLIRRVALIAALAPLVAATASFWQVRAAIRPLSLPIVIKPPQRASTPAAAAPPVQTPAPTAPPQQAQADPTSALAKWPDEEVPYIITAEERDAFQKLRADAEREQFIESFWLRRDPSAGTIRNEFREEFNQRIATANQRFFTATGIPGWRTDRGRIWIIFGPPDEMEAHGTTRTNTSPFERWRYRYIEGMGSNIILEFVDTARDGAYHLNDDPSEKGLFSLPKP